MASAPFKVKALYEYSSGHEDDLPFEIGQVITITEDDDPDWYGGEYLDASGVKQEGIFPRNFVEKYEPTAPPRPTRPRKNKDQPEHTARPEAAPESAPEAVAEPEESYEPVEEEPTVSSPPPVTEPLSPRAPAPRSAQPSPKAPAQARAPPPISEKPASFRDRIAAFNKPAAPPVAPFKPSGLGSGSSGFIKKPFVAPPPSRNAYVPPPKEAPTTKVYRREEDTEIRDKEAENLESAQHAGLLPGSSKEGQDEDQPKPTTLKERIALLQKQQAEAAQRHSEAASKKEKPKRPPPKKRTESETTQEGIAATPGIGEAPMPLERRDTESTDDSSAPKQALPTRRKSSSKAIPEDGNEADMSGAGDVTEDQEDDLTEREDSDTHPKPTISRAATGATEKAAGEEAAPNEEGEKDPGAEDDEDDDDPEARRKEELRARMAKMSGGMGMMGMHSIFGPPMPSPAAKPKKAAPMERRSSEQPGEGASTGSPTASAPPVPTMMALPGMGQQKPVNEETTEHESEQQDDDDVTPVTSTSPRASECNITKVDSWPPPLPGGRPAPPPVPTESRPPPPPPPAAVTSPSVGSESDDELSENPVKSSVEFSRPDYAPSGRAPPPPIPVGSPKLPPAPTASYMSDEAAPSSPPLPPHPSKRTSMPPPPIPGSAPAPPPPTQSRPPPPPPPGVPSRPPTSDAPVASPMQPGHLDNSEEGEVTEYDGDYDTDIASSVPHKEALKAHARDSSVEDNTPVRSPTEAPPPSLPPPVVPSAAAPRAVPPPVPSQPAPSQPAARTSVDAPRGAPPPPPPPPAKSVSYAQDDDEYDPYNYSAPKSSAPTAMSYSVAKADDVESVSEQSPIFQSPVSERREPPPAPPANRAAQRQSIDVQRGAPGRRSMDAAARPSMSVDSGYVADEVDLAEHTNWWLQTNSVPPALQGRKDIFFESDESTSSTQSGTTEVTKEIYVLFQDYSQTIITARFDPQNPADTQLDQRHEPPPRSLRQDQLEQAYERYGQPIAAAVPPKKDTVVGDGTPHGLLYELLKPYKDVLQPVGTRAYGALVYANIANASTQMHDEIRPGDIISIRNAKFQGKHGPMHAKYSMEVGKPDHVAIVAEWDGVKKKVRAWEQGRESKKVKQESFRLDDLRSGEVKIWRIMPRSWVGWDSQH
ncbi:hypothetical protein PG996_009617 [Apiospora saccharicola]|uniref:SH3 domain-containing protein n=1 Tax=Apiospora saccharicola TaxID=335842 RepID=A0ABR1ULA8_9PEZI